MTDAPDIIKRLVETFGQNIESYRSAEYNEAQVCAEFILPMFRALGWDVDNEAGHAPAYRDVIHQDAIKVGGVTKAPDYCFTTSGVRKFFLEAKKPSVRIDTDPEPAYQLRRYAWSAKLPLSILTDFEEFAVYDCRVKPSPSDKPSVARTIYMRYADYALRWGEIAGLFSKEAILKGSFDKYAESTRLKRGTAQVDDAFLSEIESWRDLLAKNIALRNASLSVRELNEAVQRTIDRVVFLRICEDRDIEQYGRLQALLNGDNVYGRLGELFNQADDKYNSGLFYFKSERGREAPDCWTLDLRIDDKVLKEIIKRLYYPECPYEFSVLPVEILGQIYERFLGKVIRLTAGHQAKVEEKPEVRKAGGVYYTPTYIVDYIVKNTVGKLCEPPSQPSRYGGQVTPKQVAELRILDPACGSGSFLLGAYQYLLDWHLKWYLEHEPERHAKGKSPTLFQSGGGPTSPTPDGLRRLNWQLTSSERKRILLDNIFGVDIDQQAVEVTKLSLLLKVLEGQTSETLNQSLKLFHERALPDLANNIKCGNSLIGPDFYEGKQTSMFDQDEVYRINAFDWHKEFAEIMERGGFDAVIGNPPWGAEFAESERDYLVDKYPTVPSKTKDSYLYFLSRCIALTDGDALLGFITPNTWLLINSAAGFRRELLRREVQQIIDHGDGVFKQATVESASLILRTALREEGECRAVRVRKGSVVVDHWVEKRIWQEDEYSRIVLEMNETTWRLLSRLRSANADFGSMCTIIWGIKPYQVGYGIPPQTREMMQKRVYHSTECHGPEWKPLLVGSDVGRYQLHFDGTRYIRYGKWLMYGSNESRMLQAKILMRQTSDILRACYDEDSYYCQNSVFIIHSSELNLKYLLGLLNSTLLRFVYLMGNPQMAKVFAEIKPSVIKKLPVHLLDAGAPADKARHDRMVELVERMLDLHKRLSEVRTEHDKEVLRRQIAATDDEIDRLAYELYGLTEEEIKIVEG